MEVKQGNLTTTLPDPTPRMTHAEWLAEGKRRFGEDFQKWRFKCPVCGHVASIGDYKPFADQGATPSSAAQECIGRYAGKRRAAFGIDSGPGPCDYALFGLFRLPGVVITPQDGGEPMMSFAFAD
jgi:hypothetical protein